MQIICISRGTFTGGQTLAEKLAAKLDYNCLSREELVESAIHSGIRVGALEMAVMRQRPLSRALAIQKERYKAWVQATLCEKALARGLVYHGRTGHLQLLAVPHVFRVRAIMDSAMRVELTMKRLDLNRDKARKYVEQVDEDRRRWARVMYNRDWQDPNLYDVLVNLSRLGLENAAAGIVPMSQLPEFQPTPATENILRDLLLAARCRLAIGEDPRTQHIGATVKAESGSVLITYLPQEQKAAPYMASVVESVEGVREVVCTMATTHLLWVQERFNVNAPSMTQILEVAAKWNAAVELIHFATGEDPSDPIDTMRLSKGEVSTVTVDDAVLRKKTGGILDDDEGETVPGEEETSQVSDRLIRAGRAGGFRNVQGSAKELLSGLDRTAPYSLVVVGDVYLHKSESVRKRLARDLTRQLAESLRVPVITHDELTARYLFGPKQWLQLMSYGALALVLVLAVFNNQAAILEFCAMPGTGWGVVRAVVLVSFVPVFAFAYGNFARFLLRLFRFE